MSYVNIEDSRAILRREIGLDMWFYSDPIEAIRALSSLPRDQKPP